MPEKNTDHQRYHITLPDGGSRYAETNLKKFVVEPWNAISSLFLLLPAIFWSIKIRRNIAENYFIFYCIPFLLMGGLGSTLFHAFRASRLLLLMDILPIMILTLSVGAYLWHKILKKWQYTFFIVFSSFMARSFLMSSEYLSKHSASNISYLISGLTIFIPAFIILYKTKFRKVISLILSAFFFTVSLIFRRVDLMPLDSLPMGTHFLWHLFSAVGSYFLAEYLFGLDKFFISKLQHVELIEEQSEFNDLENI